MRRSCERRNCGSKAEAAAAASCGRFAWADCSDARERRPFPLTNLPTANLWLAACVEFAAHSNSAAALDSNSNSNANANANANAKANSKANANAKERIGRFVIYVNAAQSQPSLASRDAKVARRPSLSLSLSLGPNVANSSNEAKGRAQKSPVAAHRWRQRRRRRRNRNPSTQIAPPEANAPARDAPKRRKFHLAAPESAPLIKCINLIVCSLFVGRLSERAQRNATQHNSPLRPLREARNIQ